MLPPLKRGGLMKNSAKEQFHLVLRRHIDSRSCNEKLEEPCIVSSILSSFHKAYRNTIYSIPAIVNRDGWL
jgi:hypothetical protein